MPRIMDPRSHLVREQFPIALEEFNGQHTYIVQRFEHLARRILGSLLYFRTDAWGRSQRQPQNAVAVMILDQRIEGRLTPLASDGDHGKLTRERNKTLHRERQLRQSVLRSLRVLGSPQNPLPLPVVAH